MDKDFFSPMEANTIALIFLFTL